MKIRLEEYCRGARVRLSVDDAPMTVLHALVNHFVMACTDVEEKQEEVQVPGPPEFVGAHYSLNEAGLMTTHPLGTGVLDDTAAIQCAVDAAAETPKRRGRPPKKVEAVQAAPEPDYSSAAQILSDDIDKKVLDGVMGAQEEPGLPFESAIDSQSTGADEPTIGPNDRGSLPEPDASLKTVTELSTDTTSSELSIESEAEITDSELQRYCAKLAQHFGTPQTVFDLAGKFVPEGAVARPTNIRDNSQRWAFVRAAEEQSGVRYHG